MIQTRIQTERAVSPEESEGVLERTELNMLTRTRRVVMRTPQRAGWEVGGIRKLIDDTSTNMPEKITSHKTLEKIDI